MFVSYKTMRYAFCLQYEVYLRLIINLHISPYPIKMDGIFLFKAARYSTQLSFNITYSIRCHVRNSQHINNLIHK